MGTFQNRTILITGGAGGLGAPLAKRLLKKVATVIVTDTDEDKREALEAAAENLPGTLSLHAFDQTQTDAIEDFIAGVEADIGAIDSLINNAAIYPKATADAVDLAEFEAVQHTNVLAHAAFAKACIPVMRNKKFGRIINVASITFDLGFTELAAYVASKGALIGLTKTWARELGRDGITVNAISPGAFQTDAEKIHPDPEGYSRFVIDQQAIKRRGTPDDFAHLAQFLLAEEAGFITGQVIRVDGGWVMG